MQFWSHDTKISRTTKFHCGNTRERHETLKHNTRYCLLQVVREMFVSGDQNCMKTSHRGFAPLKTITLPRLELCAALLLARLIVSVKKALNIHITHHQTIFMVGLDGSFSVVKQ
jgi:hypothetical protein